MKAAVPSRSRLPFVRPLLLVCAALLVPGARARAFGGVFSSNDTPIAQTSERILLVDNPDSTVTAVIQLQYAGPAQKFAWLIPVPGTPQVAVSSNTIFQRLDEAT